MKWLLSAVLIVALPGCMLELLTTTAITGELHKQNAQTATRAMQHAQGFSAKTNLESAIQAFHADKGHYPSSLNDLVPNYMASLPAQANGQPFGYDPATGRVTEGAVAAAGGPTAGDYQKMQQIQAAVNRYGQATGYYPPSLQALVPTYLSEVPRTDSGEDFTFYPQNGALYHPAQLRQQAQTGASPGGGVGIGGSGPMGEVMTGIGIQSQLNSMNQAGSAAASSRTRSQARDLETGRDDQVNQALNGLGL